jgi:hypothetical protein
LIVKNSSGVSHHLRFLADPKYNPPYGKAYPGAARERVVEFRPQPLPMTVQCDIHLWMTGYAWVFDHPYFALTTADGSFTIPRVPTGIEVHLMAWHESQGWLFTKNGKTMTLKAGKNTLDIHINIPVDTE